MSVCFPQALERQIHQEVLRTLAYEKMNDLRDVLDESSQKWTCSADRHNGTFGFVSVAAQLHMLLLVLTSQSYRCTSKHYSNIKKMTYFSNRVQKVKLEFEVFICLELLILTIPEEKTQHFTDFWSSERYELVQYSTHLNLNKAEGSMMSFLSSFSFLSQNKWALSKRVCWYIPTLWRY